MKKTLTFNTLIASCLFAISGFCAEKQESAGQQELIPASCINLDGSDWKLATDADNKGRDEKWFVAPRPEAKPAAVPGVIQEVFPSYYGLAWYYKEFTPPQNPHADGRFLLRFRAVDYKADVWVNGKPVGSHEDGEEPFVLDITDAVKPGAKNILAVRVLNPTHTPIDGITLATTARGAKDLPHHNGMAWSFGGILDSVELLVSPAVRIEDLYVIPDWKTGDIRFEANIRNMGSDKITARLDLTVAPSVNGATADMSAIEREIPVGDTLLKGLLHVSQHRLWSLDDPFLYRVTARVHAVGSSSVDEFSTRCGFRDFRYENGYFRVNGKRIFLRSAHSLWTTPITIHACNDLAMLRRDIVYAKTMGFNTIRYLPFAAPRCQLDLCDELGMMVMQQSSSSWQMGDSPELSSRFDRSLMGVIKRDRNHPSITLWYFLNETFDGPVFRYAVDVLQKVRLLDETRVCLLSSGRWDNDKKIGSLSNPGSKTWEALELADVHHYLEIPHRFGEVDFLRQLNNGKGPVFLSEYGICSAVDLPALVHYYESLNATDKMDAQYYRARLDQFMIDWKQWRLDEIFGRPEDYFKACLTANAGQRRLGLNAIRSNPNMIGYSMSSLIDHVSSGEGPITLERDLKPGAVDAIRDGFAPLRWCLFVEPNQIYRGGTIKAEVVLANEDVLRPGEYKVEVSLFGPDQKPVLREIVPLKIADSRTEPPFALKVWAKDVKIDGVSGRYRLVANFVSGAAAVGDEAEFYVADPTGMPVVNSEIILWGKDAGLEAWLKEKGIRSHSFAPEKESKRGIVLVSGEALGDVKAFAELDRFIARGSTAIFLTPKTLIDVAVPAKGNRQLRWLPLSRKGVLDRLDWVKGFYNRDDWARPHPIFAGLPSGGLMDRTFYRSILPHGGVSLQKADIPDEAVCGAIRTSSGYESGLYIAVYPLGAGKFVLNCLNIRENLGKDPVAERLLRNMLNYAAQDIDKPLVDLPADFEKKLDVLIASAKPWTAKEGDLIMVNGAIFVIREGKCCKIPSMDVFDAGGFKRENIVEISEEEKSAIPEGPVFKQP